MKRYYKDKLGRTHLEITLCGGCIEDLEEYNPYVDEDGTPIPLANIHPIQVSIEECENTLITK